MILLSLGLRIVGRMNGIISKPPTIYVKSNILIFMLMLTCISLFGPLWHKFIGNQK